MDASDLRPILPLVVIAGAVVFGMIIIAFRRSHGLICGLALVGMACAFLTSTPGPADSEGVLPIFPFLVMDHYAFFYMRLVLAASFAVAILSYDYLSRHVESPEEYYLLLLLAVLGAMTLVASGHFATFLLGLETLSIALYALIAYPRSGSRHLEAAVKYLILSALSASFLIFGMALVYAQLGAMSFSRIAVLISAFNADPVVITGTAMVIVGLGFKMAVAPFHMWTPDVYEGAPAPVTAFIATVSKGAIFALLLRYFVEVEIPEGSPLFVVFAVIATLSMFAGNLLALFQKNVKRLLAYSSIAHFGYLLVAFLSVGSLRAMAVTYYLVAYVVTMLGAFGIVTLLSRAGRDAEDPADYEGLFSRRPWLASAFTLTLLSLAGIPLTAGFMGKFLVMAAGIGSALQFLVVILVINSAIGLFYYLRLIAALFLQPPARQDTWPVSLAPMASLVVAILVTLLIWWGIYPSSLIAMIREMMNGL